MDDRGVAAAHLLDQVAQLPTDCRALPGNDRLEPGGGDERRHMRQGCRAVPAGDEDARASSRARRGQDDVERVLARHRSPTGEQPGHFSSDVGGRHLPVRVLIS